MEIRKWYCNNECIYLFICIAFILAAVIANSRPEIRTWWGYRKRTNQQESQLRHNTRNHMKKSKHGRGIAMQEIPEKILISKLLGEVERYFFCTSLVLVEFAKFGAKYSKI